VIAIPRADRLNRRWDKAIEAALRHCARCWRTAALIALAEGCRKVLRKR
jgi:HD superfamily phosphodiesterase